MVFLLVLKKVSLSHSWVHPAPANQHSFMRWVFSIPTQAGHIFLTDTRRAPTRATKPRGLETKKSVSCFSRSTSFPMQRCLKMSCFPFYILVSPSQNGPTVRHARSPRSALSTAPTLTPRAFRVAKNNALQSRGPSSVTPRSLLLTNPPATSIQSLAVRL